VDQAIEIATARSVQLKEELHRLNMKLFGLQTQLTQREAALRAMIERARIAIPQIDIRQAHNHAMIRDLARYPGRAGEQVSLNRQLDVRR